MSHAYNTSTNTREAHIAGLTTKAVGPVRTKEKVLSRNREWDRARIWLLMNFAKSTVTAEPGSPWPMTLRGKGVGTIGQKVITT